MNKEPIKLELPPLEILAKDVENLTDASLMDFGGTKDYILHHKGDIYVLRNDKDKAPTYSNISYINRTYKESKK